MENKITISEMLANTQKLMFQIDNAADISEDLIEEFKGQMQGLGDKVDNWINFLDTIDAQIDIQKQRIERAQKAKKSYESLKGRLKEYLVWCIQQNPDIPLKGQIGEFKVRKNPAKLATDFIMKSKSFSNTITDNELNELPELKPYIFRELVNCVDTKKLKDDLKKGEDIRLARLVDGYGLVIK